MVKRSFCALVLVGMLSTAALAGQAPFELIWNGVSGQTTDPVLVEPGVATPLHVQLRNNTLSALPIGGVQFNFVSPTGEVGFDLDGPDDMSPPTLPNPDRDAMADDGWQWGGPLGDPINLDGTPGTAYPLLGGGVAALFGGAFRTRLYPIFSNDPPQTVYDFSDPAQAIMLAAGETMDIGTLMITVNLAPGPSGLVPLELNDGGLPPEDGKVFDLANFAFVPVDLANAGTINLAVVSEPATAALLAIGGLLGLRRRRRS